MSLSDHESSETYVLDLKTPQNPPRLIAARKPNVRYEVEHHADQFIIYTTAEGADNGKLLSVPYASFFKNPKTEIDLSQAQELVPHHPDILIVEFLVFARHLVRLELANALPRIVIREFATGLEHSLSFDEEAYDLDLRVGYEYDTDTVRFSYSSLTTPTQVFDYDMVSRTRTLVKQQEVPSGHNSADYHTQRLWVTAKDGAQIPVTTLRHINTPLDSSAPCMLYAYASYGDRVEPSFDTDTLSLVDRGFIYAIAHCRGGTEKGWQWYLDGKKDKKVNTFTDFIAVAEGLIAQKFTQAGKIVAQGESAGGMLMGAIANLAPHLFAGIIANVPFVDCLNTILDADLPLTPPEWPEWGNPITDAQVFDTIRAYAPYENVRAQAYPALLILGGLTDPRVTYWEPAKWTARLRIYNTSQNPILFYTNMEAGHGGASGRFETLKETARIAAFALKVVDADAA
jgi:oligopeptidase B